MSKLWSHEPENPTKGKNHPLSPYYEEPPVRCNGCGAMGNPDYAFECDEGDLYCSEDCMIDHKS